MRLGRIPSLWLSLLLLISPLFSSETIKIATSAPERSPWVEALEEMKRGWEQITEGKVKIKIYAGGIAGSEEDTVRKVRLRTLGGAALSNMGMVKIYNDAYVLNAPFLFSSGQELVYVLEKITPLFKKKIEEKGFKVIIWTMAGWVHLFTKEEVAYPDDLKKFKIGFGTDEPEMEQAWKKMGYHVVPTDLKDLLIALQSGRVNAFVLSPLLAGAGQYFPFASYMSSLRLAPLVGAVVIDKRIWDRIPVEYHQPMLELVQDLSVDLYQKTIELEKEAIDAMKEQGLKVYDPPPDSLSQWHQAAQKGMGELIDKAFSAEIYQQVLDLLSEFRKMNDGK